MEIDDILKNFGQLDKTEPCKWDEVIRPESSYLVTGDVGTGKSGLAYFILERYSELYGLTPTVVGLPKSKRGLLPDNFDFLNSMDQIQSREKAIVFIDEADIQLPLDSNKNKETIVNCLSLPRQREQIFILAYHFPRLVKGTYLPFFSAFLFKRPPYLLAFASKRGSDELMQMMTKTEERFEELSPDAVVRHSYIVAPRIRWQGMLDNPLPSFWSEALSKIWSGTEIEDRLNLFDMARSPKVLTELEAMGKMEVVSPEILEIESHYLLTELRDMARKEGLNDKGTKDELCLRLISAGIRL